MEQIWERLYKEAMNVINPHEVSSTMWVGSVASAVLTKKGNIYTGICIDTNGSLGMCAERNALELALQFYMSKSPLLEVVMTSFDKIN